MVAHTPGPWIAIDGAGGFNLYVNAADGRRVADLEGDGPEGDPTARAALLADAFLLAAAPDLLAALEEQVAEFDKRMREYVDNDDDGIAAIAMQHHGDRMDRARAAIAKARGAA